MIPNNFLLLVLITFNVYTEFIAEGLVYRNVIVRATPYLAAITLRIYENINMITTV